ncbi:hypothetical protein [Blastopirellula marina]|uniref:HEAT repeat domain-containing protein n=1 Tax=Blastopirellula marina TaxID=124 RepID=A0A2S8F4F5_9BACT|nr:hypothetical protein [Blastopirellula marina]PQO27020.1 hypothetical protein C5Y98_27570 [Blastopirellula marina]PTL41167.1 hypothetical protein C5Y97_27585 [Blastopirellula marina]
MNQAKPSRVAKWMWEGSILLIVILVGVLFWQDQSAEKANRAWFLQNQKLEQGIADQKEKIAATQAAIAAELESGVPLVAVHTRNRSWHGPPASSSTSEIELALIRQLQDERQQVQAHALIGLRYFVSQQGGNSTIVAQVTPFVHNPRLKSYAMNILRQAGPSAKGAVPDILATVSCEYWYPLQKAIADVRRIDPDYDLIQLLGRYIVEDRYGKETFKNLIENFKPYEVALAYEAAAAMVKTPEKQTHIQQVQAYMKSPLTKAGPWSDQDFQRYLKSTSQPQAAQ